MCDNLEARLEKLDPTLFDHIVRLDEATKQMTDQYPKPQFMAKDGHDHAKRMLRFLVPIEARLKERLSANELFVLCATIYLHDIGMYCYFYLADQNMESFNEEVFHDLDADACLKLYNAHSDFSSRYISENHAGKISMLPIELTDMPYTSSIAKLAKLHKDRRAISKTVTPDGLRLRLLKALLQFADAGDMTKERAVANNKGSDKEVSFDTYWKFKYIEGPGVVDHDGKLIYYLRYRIPPGFIDYFKAYVQIVEYRFKRTEHDAVDVINEYGAAIDVDGTIGYSKPITDESIEMMPKGILDALRERSEDIDPVKRIEKHVEAANSSARKREQHHLSAANFLEAAKIAAGELDFASGLDYVEKAIEFYEPVKHLRELVEAYELAAKVSDKAGMPIKATGYFANAIDIAKRAVDAKLIDVARLLELREKQADHFFNISEFEKAANAYLQLGKIAPAPGLSEYPKEYYSRAASLFRKAGDVESQLVMLDLGAEIAEPNGGEPYLEALMDLLVARIRRYETDWLARPDWLGREVLVELFAVCEEVADDDKNALRKKRDICRRLISEMRNSGNEDLLPLITLENTRLRAQLHRVDGRFLKYAALRMLDHLTSFGESVRNIVFYSLIIIIVMGVVYSLANFITASGRPANILQGIAFSFTTFCSLSYNAFQPTEWYVHVLCAFEFFAGVCAFGLIVAVIVRKASLRFY